MLERVKRRLSLSWTARPSRREEVKGKKMASAVVEAGVECETFHRLATFIGTERFLEKLKQEQQLHQQPQGCTSAAAVEMTEVVGGTDTRSANISELIRDAMSTSITSSSFPDTAGAPGPSTSASSITPLDDPDYVMIDKQSAVEAMAFFIAQTLMTCPQAFTMPPAKLQDAIIIAIQGMKQSKFKRLCTAGRHAYRWSALGYSAFQMYSNPWICQAIIQALWAFSRMTMRSWV